MDDLFGKTVGSKKRFNCSVWFCFEDFISLYYIIQFYNRNRFTLFFRLNTKKYCMLYSRTAYKDLPPLFPPFPIFIDTFRYPDYIRTMKEMKPIPYRHRPRGLTILYEDRDIIVIDKSAGLLTIKATYEKEKTAHHILTTYIRKGSFKSKKQLFVVHRLDRDTSGVLEAYRLAKANNGTSGIDGKLYLFLFLLHDS